MSSATGRGHRAHPHDGPRRDARAVAVEALMRVDEGAYANLVLPHVLERADLSGQDRNFVTELVYGTTRMRRACDWLVDRYLVRAPDAETRAVLRLGAYQLVFLRTPAHAAVSATVSVAPRRTRGLVNAVLRRVAAAGSPSASLEVGAGWPSQAIALSYPDWIVGRLAEDLGERDAYDALERMNTAPQVAARDDGYIQDRASQWVSEVMAAGPGQRLADLCAAPGGKTTALAAAGPGLVVGADARPSRAGLVAANAARLGLANVSVVVADGTAPALRPGSLDGVLVDAPCSGLGVLRRRADARWRVEQADVDTLASLQRLLISSAATLLRPGGVLVYSVCTLTSAETVDVDRWLATNHRELTPDALGPPWRPAGRGGRLLPQDEDTDGMFVLRLRLAS